MGARIRSSSLGIDANRVLGHQAPLVLATGYGKTTTTDHITGGNPLVHWGLYTTVGMETMSESGRQAPGYGEYASDEEHASALKRSGVDPAQVKASAPQADDHSRHESTERSAGSSANRPSVGRAHTPSGAPSGRRVVDRLVTIFFLTFGAISVIGGASNYLNIGSMLHESVQQFGMGEYDPPEQAAAMGVAMLVSQIVFWAAAAAWSYRRISRGKLSWWVPVLVGVVSFVVLSAMLGSLLAADPGFVPTLSAR